MQSASAFSLIQLVPWAFSVMLKCLSCIHHLCNLASVSVVLSVI